MSSGFDGLMMMNVRRGLQIKKEKQIKNMTLKVLRADGAGMMKVVFKEVQESYLPEGYTLTGTCTIDGVEHTFEHVAPPYGMHNSTIIGFLPVKERVPAT